jgi:hypothetical protein
MDGQAKLITCANCFAHMKDIHDVLEGIVEMLSPDGVFISESTYLIDTLDKLQYDTIYHEHLRYYSLTSLRNLLAQHGLHIFRAKKIPTHGGSIRVYAKRNVSGTAIDRSLTAEPTGNRMRQRFEKFREDVFASKLNLLAKFNEIEKFGLRVWGIGAPSRAATVINYCRLDAMNIPYVLETKGSLKIGKYMPGTDIEVHEELPFDQLQSDYLILFSWHLADELIPKLRAKGYKGKFIMPCEPLDRAENLSQSYHR